MSVSLCIHGHFYQPPREDPWLGRILVETSAAPMRDWNQRILRESYAPLAWARRLDGEGRIQELRNCYEWINFNVGPTLMHWLRRENPELLARMRLGDELSRKRLGHGNAMAQIYHHMILPLATERDKLLETVWAIEDFRYHFGRRPEGMWLSECAVDSASLEILAAKGIRFVVLAPRQARALVTENGPAPVDEGSLDIGEPYLVRMPSGAFITAVFYHGPLSQGIAFEGLLRDGERFWQRISSEASGMNAQGQKLLCLATDGETYGHHFTFGEMALAHVLAQAESGRDGIALTNLAAHIAANPPHREILLHEPSSWSCVHGIERWRSDCGCTDGGHPGWNQRWRAPLREALDLMRRAVDAHFENAGKDCFIDPLAALEDYGSVLADPHQREQFAARWFIPGGTDLDRGWKLLAMQEQALAAFASCAWFFDDISRIEPENGLTFALHALELMHASGGPDLRAAVADVLEKALSNQPGAGTGKTVFERDVLPRRNDPATLCLLAWLLLDSLDKSPGEGRRGLWSWPSLSVELLPDGPLVESGPGRVQYGLAILRAQHESLGARHAWKMTVPDGVRREDASFTALAGCRIEVLPLPHAPSASTDASATGEAAFNGGVSQITLSRQADELARPLREYLVSSLLENRERRLRPVQRADAAHVLSLFEVWTEAQHDLPSPEYWTGLFPYLALESMYAEDFDDKRREQLATVLARYMEPGSRTLAGQLATDGLIRALGEGHPQDAKLAEWVRRVRLALPDMDWWAVQNHLWDKGTEKWPLLSAELYFARRG